MTSGRSRQSIVIQVSRPRWVISLTQRPELRLALCGSDPEERRPAMYIGASLGGILILLLILWVLGVIH